MRHAAKLGSSYHQSCARVKKKILIAGITDWELGIRDHAPGLGVLSWEPCQSLNPNSQSRRTIKGTPRLTAISFFGGGRFRDLRDSFFAPPEFNRSVKTARGEIMTVGTEGHGGDGFQMPFQRARLKP